MGGGDPAHGVPALDSGMVSKWSAFPDAQVKLWGGAQAGGLFEPRSAELEIAAPTATSDRQCAPAAACTAGYIPIVSASAQAGTGSCEAVMCHEASLSIPHGSITGMPSGFKDL